jgi:hypothetical protein
MPEIKCSLNDDEEHSSTSDHEQTINVPQSDNFVEEEIKNDEILKKSSHEGDMTAIDSFAIIRAKKKKRQHNSKRHSRLVKQKSMRSYGTTAEMQRNTKLMGIEEIEEDGGVCQNNLMKNNIEDDEKTPDELMTKKAPERLNMSTPLLKH